METSMNLKLVVVVSLFAAMPTLAYAQKAGPATNAPKPAVAEAQKVVQIISGDKAKLQAYCDLGKVQDQMQQAGQKKDQKTLQALSAQASSLEQKVGPDYVKLMNGLDEVDPNSAEGKRFTAVFDPLDKQCK
jgi:hypothetical protein